MCEPVSIGIGLSALSTGLGFVAADAAADQENASRAQTRKNAISSYETQIKQGAVQADQSDQAVALKLTNAKIKGAQAEASVLAQAGESGIGGNSVALAVADFNAQEARYESSVLQQADFDSINRQFQLEGMQAAATGRVQSAAPVAGPSAALALLDFGSDAATSYFKFNPTDGGA